MRVHRNAAAIHVATKFATVVAVSIASAAPQTVHAQSPTTRPLGERGPAVAWQARHDNDLYAIRGVSRPPDYDYTSGVSLTAALSDAPRWMRRAATADGQPRPGCRREADAFRACLSMAIGMHQDLYTPHANTTHIVAGERPYAAWLYASSELRWLRESTREARLRTVAVDLGVIGPVALGRVTQNSIHHITGGVPRLGWRYQLPNAVGASIRASDAHRIPIRMGGAALARHLAPAFTARAIGESGSIRTLLGAGVEMTVGLFGASPWHPDEPLVVRPRRVQLDAGYRRELVLHDAFIEGRAGVLGARRRASVGQFDAGASVRAAWLTLSYRFTSRQREYEGGRTSHPWGSFAITAQR